MLAQDITIQIANTKRDYEAVVLLFEAYSTWCRANFVKHGMVEASDDRLTSFNQEEVPGVFAEDGCAILIAYGDDREAGCAFLRKLDDQYCEMKRLYVAPEFRRTGLGLRLMEDLMALAVERGYRYMRITSHSQYMGKAIKMYHDYGFYNIDNYVEDPLQAGDTYMEYNLQKLK